MSSHADHIANPRTPLVALEGGPSYGRWFFYRDWLALRRSSRRSRYSLDRPCGSCRCYLPTNRLATNTDPTITERHGEARVWEYIPPEQWTRWGRQYFTPEETLTYRHGETEQS
jgi:hypothetical protein